MEISTLIQILKEAEDREKAGGLGRDAIAPMGWGQEVTWSNYLRMLETGRLNPNDVRLKESSLTLGADTLYGCTGLFSLCGPDEIIGMSMQDDPLISWLGFFPDTVCEKFIKGWVYSDVDGAAAGSASNVYGAPCDDPPTTEKGVCEYVIGDFGSYRACGEAIDVSKLGQRKCDKQPTYTIPLQGVGPVRIDNDLDLETIQAGLAVKHEISRHVITGDANTAYQFDGLNSLVSTGYVSTSGDRCYSMDSWVLDWGNDDMEGATNGYGSIIGAVRTMWRNIRWRIMQTGMGMPREGDVVLVMPYWMARVFLDEWAWWSLRNGTQYNEVFRDNLALREFRDRFNGGRFGGGYINIDGFNIHIIEHDWFAISQNAPYFCGDIYMLVRSIGGRRVLTGQYMPSDMGVSSINQVAGYNYFNVEAIQGGRGLRWVKFDNACAQPCVLFRPRLYLETPWAQGKIENICIDAGVFDPMSLDPQSNYFFEDNLQEADTITQYWYDDTGWFH